MASSKLHQSLKHTTTCIATLKTQSQQINCLAINNTLLYVASTNIITVFDMHRNTTNNFSLNVVDSFWDDPSSGSIKAIAFNNSKVLTAHQDCKIRVWQMNQSEQHHLLSTLPTLKDRFRHFILPSNYVSVRRHRKKLWIEHSDTVSGLVVHEGLVYSVSWDKSLKIWNTKNNRCLESINKAHEDAVNTLVVSKNGTVYTASADGLIGIWERLIKDNKIKHRLVNTLERHKSAVNALMLSDDGSVLFSGGCDRSILVWRRDDGDQRMVFVEALWGHTGAVLCLTNASRWMISGSADQTVRVWQQNGKSNGYQCVVVLEGHERPVKSVAASASGGFSQSLSICSGSLDGEIKVWEISDKICVRNEKN